MSDYNQLITYKTERIRDIDYKQTTEKQKIPDPATYSKGEFRQFLWGIRIFEYHNVP